MVKLRHLVIENLLTETEESDISEPIIVTEAGYNYLVKIIEDLNKKAVKYKVPPMELQVLKEEYVKEKHVVDSVTGQPVQDSNHPNAELREITVKKYHIRINGEPPRIDGYEFIAKIEHTEAGNIMNFNPKATVKNLPTEYVSAAQRCDVCHTQRDRNNTFILRMEKDDAERFPSKKEGDLLMVGSSCLKRFLPGISTEALIGYAEMIDFLRKSVEAAGEMDDERGGYGGGRGNYVQKEKLIHAIAAVYQHEGKYISRKKSQEFNVPATLDMAYDVIWPMLGRKNAVLEKLKEDESFKEKVNSLTNEYLQWEKTKDWNEEAAKKPEYQSFYSNCSIISKLEQIRHDNANKLAAMFGIFLYDKGQIEKKAAQQKAGEGMTYLGEVGGKVRMKVKVTKIREYDGQFGRQLIVSMVGESTGADGSVKKGNVTYFTSNFELGEGEEAEIEATVKKQEVSKYTNLPDTQITRAKILNFITHPEKNVGKEKLKEWTGIVKLRVSQREDWSQNGATVYNVSGNVDIESHPDLVNYNGWGPRFSYDTMNRQEAEQFHQYENQKVKVKIVFARAMKVDDWKAKGAVLKSIQLIP